MRIAIVYGSTSGKTQTVAERLQSFWPGSSVWSVADLRPAALGPFDAVVFGTSTWGTGEVQADWARRWADFVPACSGKVVAFFGLGDRAAFADTFCHGADLLAARLGPAALRTAGPVLKLDHDNQPHLTEGRLAGWVEKLADAGLDSDR